MVLSLDRVYLTARERFPSKAVEVTPVPFNVELAKLRQRLDEPLASYNISKRTSANVPSQ